MNKEKRIRIMMLLAAVVLYIRAVSFCNYAKKDADLLHIVLARGMDGVMAESIFLQERELDDPVGFCFWGESKNQLVSCAETGAFTQVTNVLLSGNPGLMGAESLTWQTGCLIDEATAQTLFGTVQCKNQVLWRDGVSYQVLGTVSTLRPTMLAIAAAEDGNVLNRCVLSVPAEKGSVLGRQFLMRWGLQGSILDFFPIWALTNDLLLLLPGIFLLAFAGTLRKDWRKLTFSGVFSGTQLRLLMKMVPAFLVATGAVWFLGSRLIIPQDMIPSRWSDFSFWGNWWEAQKENLMQILFTPMGNGQLQMMRNMIKSMVNSTAAAMLALWKVRRRDDADITD